MKHFEVRSSNIQSVGHEPRTGLMQVRFRQGGLYQYGNVSAELFQKMVMSDSIGKFFGENIKGNSNHQANKLED